jgi:hypothetical protein
MFVHLVDDEVWVTLASDDVTALGAMVVCQSLRQVCTNRVTLVMVTPAVSLEMRYTHYHQKLM